jgi:hypothetical protein
METRKGIFRDALDSALALVMMAFPLFIGVVRRFLRPQRGYADLEAARHRLRLDSNRGRSGNVVFWG